MCHLISSIQYFNPSIISFFMFFEILKKKGDKVLEVISKM